MSAELLMCPAPQGKSPHPVRLDPWLGATALAGMAILLIGAFRHWPISWWLYMLAFSLRVAMPLWAASHYRRA